MAAILKCDPDDDTDLESCPNCGSKTAQIDAGTRTVCPNCAALEIDRLTVESSMLLHALESISRTTGRNGHTATKIINYAREIVAAQHGVQPTLPVADDHPAA